MNIKKVNKFFILLPLLSFFILLNSFSQSAFSANRRTAIRYLQNAKQYASQKQWAEADSQAILGLAYDDSIADLWYIRAVAQTGMNVPVAQVLPLVTTALTEGEWVDYNRDGARILYADILCTTGKHDLSLGVLDTKPFLYSADAEFIRAKSFYNLNTHEDIERARSKIDAARKIYPLDTRFALLFFKFENKIGEQSSDEVQKIAKAFIAMIPNYRNVSAELQMYAILFASGDEKTRMLKSFNARSLKHPLFAQEALKAGLLDQESALSYLLDFADKEIDFNILVSFVPLITEEKPKKEFGEYLTAYNGIITEDTDGDLLPNLTVSYNRGRPAKVVYDKNQDEEDEWNATCDFGVPVSVHLTEGDLDIFYGSWPSIEKAVYSIGKDTPDLTFNLVAETLLWTPFKVEDVKIIHDSIGIEFFMPVIPDSQENVTAEELVHAASSYEIPSEERAGAIITVSMLDGVPQLARYSVKGVMYAQTQFNGGLPLLRTVDADGDGLFETTETYGFSPDRDQKVISKSDESQIMTNLFGSPGTGAGIYVSMIQIDSNGDTIPDFTEEYLENGGKISSWDTNADGLWDTRYVKYAPESNGSVKEDSMFHQPLTDSVVIVTSVDGIPVSVSDGDKHLKITKDSKTGIYWLGIPGSEIVAKKIISEVNQSTTQGVCNIYNAQDERVLAVRIGKMIIGEMLPAFQAVEQDENEKK